MGCSASKPVQAEHEPLADVHSFSRSVSMATIPRAMGSRGASRRGSRAITIQEEADESEVNEKLIKDIASSAWCENCEAAGHDVFLSYREVSEGKKDELLPRANNLVAVLDTRLLAMDNPKPRAINVGSGSMQMARSSSMLASSRTFAFEPGESMEQRKLRVFYDKRCLSYGENWEESLNHAMESCALMVLLISPEAIAGIVQNAENRRDNLLLEFETALRRHEDGECLVLPVFVNFARINFSETGYPNKPHFFSGRNIRRTVVEVLKLQGVKIQAPSSPDEINEVVKAALDLLSSKERFKIRAKAKKEDKATNADISWRKMKPIVEAGVIIGEGASAKVFKGALASGELVAIKQLTIVAGRDAQAAIAQELFDRELEIMLQLDHPNILPLLDSCARVDDKGFKQRYLLMSLAEGGSLQDALFDKDHPGQPRTGALPDWRERVGLLRGTALGLQYLHGHSRGKRMVLHRDLKCGNILIDATGNARICDFGVSRQPEPDQTSFQTVQVVKSAGYDAPEVTMTAAYSPKTDVYALGVVIAQMASGKPSIMLKKKMPTRLRAYIMQELAASAKLDHFPPGGEVLAEHAKGLLDPRCPAMPLQVLTGLIQVALRCTDDDRDVRSPAGEVAQLLADMLKPSGGTTDFGNRPERLAVEDYEGTSSGLECFICCAKPRNTVFHPCEHAVACDTCVTRMQHGDGEARGVLSCPLCCCPVAEVRVTKEPVFKTYVGTGTPLTATQSKKARAEVMRLQGIEDWAVANPHLASIPKYKEFKTALDELADNAGTAGNFGSMALEDAHAAAIAGALAGNTACDTLMLFNNNIGAAGASVIAAALARPEGCSPSPVKKLYMGNNRIADDGAASLAPALHGLSELAISGNELTCEGAGVVAAALRRPGSSLTRVWLGQNLIGEEGGRNLAEAVLANTTLEALHLATNRMSVDTQALVVTSWSGKDPKGLTM